MPLPELSLLITLQLFVVYPFNFFDALVAPVVTDLGGRFLRHGASVRTRFSELAVSALRALGPASTRVFALGAQLALARPLGTVTAGRAELT